MSKTIEEVEKERDAAIEAGLNLARIVRERIDSESSNPRTIMAADDAIAAIEALRPKPKPLELWVNATSSSRVESGPFYDEQTAAKYRVHGDRTAHLREVLPAPKWERWSSDSAGVVKTESGRFLTGYVGTGVADMLCETHNAEMERLAALWEGGEG